MKLKVIKDPIELDLMAIRLKNTQAFSFDTETTGLDPWKAEAFMLSFSDGETAWVVPKRYFTSKLLSSVLTDIFAEPKKEVIGHNLKFDLHFLKNTFGVTCHRQLHDTCLQGFLLDENRPNGLKPLAREILNYKTSEEDLVKKWLEANFSKKEDYRYDSVPEEITAPYSGSDAWLTFKLHETLQPRIKEHFLDLYNNERQVLRILYKMEQNGLKVDVPYLQELALTYELKATEQMKAVWKIAGEEFDVNSNDQLSRVLFTKLGIPCPIFTAKGNQSTAEEALNLIDHPIVEALKKYRETAHDLSTSIKSPLELVDKNGYLHSDYSINRAKTGRFSCSRPNNQNVKKDPAIKRAYIVEPDEEAWLFDQSQIEMVGFAQYSKDVKMLKALENNVDLHAMTAATVYEKPIENVTKQERAIGKGTNFAIVYGCGDRKLASFINNYMTEGRISDQEAAIFKNRYKAKFPAVTSFTQRVIYAVKQNRAPWGHFVKNQFGRVRRLDPVNKAYTGVNHLIQGWAADLMKRGMVRLEKSLGPIWRQNIHDAIRVDHSKQWNTPEQKKEWLMEVSKCLTDFPEVEPNIKVTIETFDTNWADAVEVKL